VGTTLDFGVPERHLKFFVDRSTEKKVLRGALTWPVGQQRSSPLARAQSPLLDFAMFTSQLPVHRFGGRARLPLLANLLRIQ